MNKIDLSIFKNIIAYGIGQSYYHLLPRLSHVKFNYVMDKRWEENLEEYQCDGIEIIRKKDICHLVNVLIVVIPESESIFNQVSEAFADYDNVEICRVFELVKSVQSVSGSNLQKLLPITEYKDEYGNTIRFDESVSDNINITFYGNNNKVVIGNNVEIGANTAIDRGTIENTIVGDNTKIDDLVMIGHNCKIGSGCMIVSQVGIAGSCVIGDRVVIAGQAGLADHIQIGDDTLIAAQSGVTKSFPAKSIVVGAPAVPRKEFIKQLKIMKDAGDLIAKFKKYEPLLKSFEEGVNEGVNDGVNAETKA